MKKYLLILAAAFLIVGCTKKQAAQTAENQEPQQEQAAAQEPAADENAYMQFTLPGANTTAKKVMLTDATKQTRDGKTYYVMFGTTTGSQTEALEFSTADYGAVMLVEPDPTKAHVDNPQMTYYAKWK